MNRDISIVIPTYKKTAMLVKNLRHNVPFFDNHEVIVVNDDPDESIKHYLKDFSGITLIELPSNLGFAGAIDTGIRATKGSYVVLLNSDVLLNDDSYLDSLEEFKHDLSLFAIAFAQRENDAITGGKNILYWEKGFALHRRANHIKRGNTAWAEGGACSIDKTKYLKLGGFRRIYSPFYWEDVDLSYRARKAGYHILFQPTILVDHQHESTIGTLFQKQFIQTIAYRNQILFVWLNIRDMRLLVNHIFHLTRMIVLSVFRDRIFFHAFLRAVVRIFQVPDITTQVHYIHHDNALLQKP